MSPYKAYKLYLALKQHFKDQDYDFFKYRGKVTASFEAYEKRNDKFKFEKISRHNDCAGYLLSNIKNKPDLWIGDLGSEECDEIYFAWKKRIDTLTYTLKEEAKLNNFQEKFLVVDGKYPELLRLNNAGRVSDETICLLNRVINFLPIWDKKIKDKFIYPQISLRYRKYDPFIDFDKDKLKTIVTNIAREH